ncbi:hypothetical protein SDC9_163518 [bioreactor metagenome]|uniref:Uncharacterized protein n=1 Tax=bioreactor metagenome TaxID=1076179 RepID=A0A645FQJ5_9ZZZZ
MRQAGNQVSAFDFDIERFLARERRADIDFHILGRAFAYEQIVLFAHVADNGVVEFIAGDLDRFTQNGAAQ